jgi:hypothetical protein
LTSGLTRRYCLEKSAWCVVLNINAVLIGLGSWLKSVHVQLTYIYLDGIADVDPAKYLVKITQSFEKPFGGFAVPECRPTLGHFYHKTS